MFSRNREKHIGRAERSVGIGPVVHCVLAVSPSRLREGLFQRNHQPTEVGRGINISGVDFWHAVEFSRNGRFLWSRFTGSLRALPFGLAFPTLSDFVLSDFLGAFQVSLSG